MGGELSKSEVPSQKVHIGEEVGPTHESYSSDDTEPGYNFYPTPGEAFAGVDGDWEIRNGSLFKTMTRRQALEAILFTQGLEDVALTPVRYVLLTKNCLPERTENGMPAVITRNSSLFNSERLLGLLLRTPDKAIRVQLDMHDYFWVDYTRGPNPMLKTSLIDEDMEPISDEFNMKPLPFEEGVRQIVREINSSKSGDKIVLHANLRDALFYNYRTVRLNTYALGISSDETKDLNDLKEVYEWMISAVDLQENIRTPPPNQEQNLLQRSAYLRAAKPLVDGLEQVKQLLLMLDQVDNGVVPNPSNFAFVSSIPFASLEESRVKQVEDEELLTPLYDIEDLDGMTFLKAKRFLIKSCLGEWERKSI